MKFFLVNVDIAARKDLTLLDKFIFGVIDTYDMKYDGCYLTNKKMADMLNVNPGSLANIISKLKKIGLVGSVQITRATGDVRKLFNELNKELSSDEKLMILKAEGFSSEF